MASVIDVVGGLHLVTKGIPPRAPAEKTFGEWRFFVKSTDPLFQESTTTATCAIARSSFSRLFSRNTFKEF